MNILNTFSCDSSPPSNASNNSNTLQSRSRSSNGSVTTESEEYIEEIPRIDHGVNYGDLSQNYDTQSRISVDHTALVESICLQVLQETPLFGSIKQSNIFHVSLSQKSFVLQLLRRNMSLGINPPFDRLALSRLEREVSPESRVNQLCILEGPIPASLAACIAAFNFLEVFKASELSLLGRRLEPLLALKKACASHPMFLSIGATSHVIQSILLNIFALTDSRFMSETYKFDCFNYVIWLFLMSQVPAKHSKETREVTNMYMETLVLNGMLDWTMFSHLERFIASSPYPYRPALEELLNSLSSLLKRCLPLKLSELARVAVKHSLKEFSKKYVDKLPIFASIKSYLFYEELFTSYCETAKNLS